MQDRGGGSIFSVEAAEAEELDGDSGDSAPVGSVRSDQLDSQLADRLEEAYRTSFAV